MCFTFKPLALLIALRGLSTLNTLRIFTTEMALDLQSHRGKCVYLNRPNVRGEKERWERKKGGRERERDSLHSHGQQGDCDHDQIQDVEGVTTEGSFMHERTIDCHLSDHSETQITAVKW